MNALIDPTLSETGASHTNYVQKGQLKIAQQLFQFIEAEALPGTGIVATEFWSQFEKLLSRFIPVNKALLEKRESLQKQIDQWHKTHVYDADAYTIFLKEIGYLVEEVEDFKIETSQVDPEIAHIAGPQLVVPVKNARFALNAANARWGSLYDALYGTDVLPKTANQQVKGYDPERGQRVIDYAKAFLDNAVPLKSGSYTQVTGFSIEYNKLNLICGDAKTELKDPKCFVGYQGEITQPTAILLRHNDLHIEIQIDAEHVIGKQDPAHIKDLVLESAITTIQDCEDSVAAVDAEDKTDVYRNWLGLMKGDLTASFNKQGQTHTRHLNEDRHYITGDSGELTLPGRSLLLVRNVGHLMTNPAMLFAEEEAPEGVMDALITSLISVHDLIGKSTKHNSRENSIYIVKPKMHGPEEVDFACDVFNAVEDILNLPRYTIKIGIMDEERRTSVNLKSCIHAAKERLIFINTGFLDRTGDEIHTSMKAGPFIAKGEMKSQPWITAYEKWNVEVGLQCGLQGKAQIGKGMWPKPDEMKEMMQAKSGHPLAGANCAWVPSPTAATLHVMHYHQVNVKERQNEIKAKCNKQSSVQQLTDLLTIPLIDVQAGASLDKQVIQAELDNNAQGILGYVVRWIDHGVGCSKVPDINDVGLMEDRATLRISSQYITNWLLHGLVSKEQVMETLKRMASVVDKQNAHDDSYTNMSDDLESNIAFKAACDLIFEGEIQPSGYTEPLLHKRRREFKAS